MKILKKIFLLITFVFSLFIFPTKSLASSGQLKVTSSSTTVIVGNTVTVNVTLSSSQAIGAWEFDINYDTSFLKLTSSNAENNGTYFVNAGDGSQKTKTYTLKFRALKSGSTNITVGSYDIYAFDKSSMSITKSNKKLNIMTQAELEATYSKDNNLKSLSVEGYELDKAFNKDTLEYTVNVPTGTTSVKIKAIENDAKASVSGTGEIEVTEGLNTIPIIVTAQNGSEKTYMLKINVEDLNPINVTDIDGNSYTIVKNGTLLTAPATFMETKVTINSIEIPAFRNNAADITLVGLKDSVGTISLFVYEDNIYKPYNEMNLKNYLLIPVSFEQELDLIKTTITINEEVIDAYKYSENSEVVIINAKSLEDGKIELYLYDPANKAAIRYDDTYIKESSEILENYSYVIIAFAGALFIMLILILCLLHSLRKKQKKIKKFIAKQEAKIEATRKLNDVIKEVKEITDNEKPKIKQDITELREEKIDSKEERVLSKKELKKMKQNEAKQKEGIIEEKETVEIKEIKIEDIQKEKTNDELDDSEEVYNLFEDDKKRKKKKK